jgi:hypothetical protein
MREVLSTEGENAKREEPQTQLRELELEVDAICSKLFLELERLSQVSQAPPEELIQLVADYLFPKLQQYLMLCAKVPPTGETGSQDATARITRISTIVILLNEVQAPFQIKLDTSKLAKYSSTETNNLSKTVEPITLLSALATLKTNTDTAKQIVDRFAQRAEILDDQTVLQVYYLLEPSLNIMLEAAQNETPSYEQAQSIVLLVTTSMTLLSELQLPIQIAQISPQVAPQPVPQKLEIDKKSQPIGNEKLLQIEKLITTYHEKVLSLRQTNGEILTKDYLAALHIDITTPNFTVDATTIAAAAKALLKVFHFDKFAAQVSGRDSLISNLTQINQAILAARIYLMDDKNRKTYIQELRDNKRRTEYRQVHEEKSRVLEERRKLNMLALEIGTKLRAECAAIINRRHPDYNSFLLLRRLANQVGVEPRSMINDGTTKATLAMDLRQFQQDIQQLFLKTINEMGKPTITAVQDKNGIVEITYSL